MATRADNTKSCELAKRKCIKVKTPFVGTKRGFVFLTLSKARENMAKCKRILLRLTMKNGLELKAPVTDDISRALAFAIKWVAVGVAVSPMLYGLAKLVIALKS